MVAELFLQESRPIAVTIATIVNWLANFVVGLAFPYILVSLQHTHFNLVSRASPFTKGGRVWNGAVARVVLVECN